MLSSLPPNLHLPHVPVSVSGPQASPTCTGAQPPRPSFCPSPRSTLRSRQSGARSQCADVALLKPFAGSLCLRILNTAEEAPCIWLLLPSVIRLHSSPPGLPWPAWVSNKPSSCISSAWNHHPSPQADFLFNLQLSVQMLLPQGSCS